jgi:beta-glucuronidase
MLRVLHRLGVGLLGLLALAAAPSVSAGAAPSRSLILSEGWLFQPDPHGVGDAQGWHRAEFDRSGWRRVVVPMAWDHYESVMDGYEGVGWYALTLPAEHVVPGAWQRLRFGRANHRATVWIDGQKAGENLTGYLPFEIAASPWLKPGRPASVVVRVENGTRYDWLPGTTRVEWVQYGGLLEPVELLTTALAHVTHVAIRATPRGADGHVAVVVEVENASDAAFAGRVRFEADARTVEAEARVAPRATASVALELVLPKAWLWSLESPALYKARVRLFDARGEIDSVSDRFGVRSIEARGRQILLNGRPLRIRVATATILRARPCGRGRPCGLEAVKATGANFVRVHYPQTPPTLAIADEIGLLYMEEVPLNWWRAAWHPKIPPEFENDRIIDVAEKALEEMVRRDGNHPALVVWSMANECQTADELGIRAMERLLRRAKALDPTRLATYVSNRRQEQNRAFALADFVAVNLYYGMFDEPLAANLGEIEEHVYAPTRRRLAELAAFFADKPLVLTEFGTIGIPGSGGDMRFSEEYQAAFVSAVWRAVEAVPEVSGGVVWSWADYRHRRGFTNDFPTYFGPFGIVTLDRRPKKAHAALRALWTVARSDR